MEEVKEKGRKWRREREVGRDGGSKKMMDGERE